jgi:riboflavin kinase/FMN adenylyltransferase
MRRGVSAVDLDPTSIVSERDFILAVGTFDGVHLGHRYLVQQVIRRARERGCLSGAITFHPHPRAVVTGQAVQFLCTLDERLALLRGLGLDAVVALAFTTDLARLSALDFMSLLCESVRVRELWVGSDFALGCGREGTVTRLAEIGYTLGYEVHGVAPLAIQGQTVSSTRIRELIGQGEVEAAARLLARQHHVTGIAMPGGRGDQRLGLLTASVAVSDGLAVPANGSYLARVCSGEQQWSANVRVEPSLVGAAPRLEVSPPDVPAELCGQPLRVEFVRRLRQIVQTERVSAPREKLRAQSPVVCPA